ncbi:ferritin family protein [Geoalkalibacter ferrihydriticus]|nr:ferritin family protein [Geoalkalibacter ferrihydriticus]
MKEAIKTAVQTEKDVMDFYSRAAQITQNERGRKVFEQLAKEEKEHCSHFFKIYPGNDLGSFEQYIQSPPRKESAMLRNLEKALDENVHERRAMEIALKEEEDLARVLEGTATNIIDPAVRTVFDRMAKETRDHFAVIESEYARLMGMVHETDIDTYVRE